MRWKRSSVCPSGCTGGYAERQVVHALTDAELASLPDLALDRRCFASAPPRWCSYCGCVYLRADPPLVLGFKDWEPIGSPGWVPKRSATG